MSDVGTVQDAAPTSAAVAARRLHTVVAALAVTLLVFAQDSGQVATDTKLDLLVDPWTFLRRGVALWDPRSAGGTLGDQAYGYAFPIGPFFGIGHSVGLAPWVVQRGWESAVLVAALVGAAAVTRALVAGRLGVRTAELAGLAAGLAYALAPRTLTELTSISSELMPVAALPWVLLPLVRAGDDPAARRHAAAVSGLALLFAGGVNASATLAVLPVPALWLLTRADRRWAARVGGWWVLAVLAACLWWLVPLLALGRYSPPFLDWIESAAVTTNPVSLLAELRGVDHWQAYLGPSIWPAGWALVSLPVLVVATTAVAAVGLVGLSRRDLPHRAFLLACLVVGLVLVGFGHVGPASAPWAASARPLLDGPLVAFRNIHKFDPVIRLPLAVGIGYAVAAAADLPRRVNRVVRGLDLTVPARAVTLAAVVAVGVAAAGPALAGGLVSQGRTTVLAPWWPVTADWLAHATAAEPAPGRALVVPGSGGPVYYWGGTTDDALQPVAQSPWTARSIAPLAQPGYVRLLDVVEQMLRGERDPTTLPVLLARMGVEFVVLRHDLDARLSGATDQQVVRPVLVAAGFPRAAGFGPETADPADPDVAAPAPTGRPAVEVFRVPTFDGGTALAPLAGAVVANGASDTLTGLVDRGLDARTPVLFGPAAGVADAARPTRVLTDGVARRDIAFGDPGYVGETLAAGAPFATPRAAHDHLPADVGPLSTVRYDGVTTLTSSSSGARPDAFVDRSAASQEWSAFDGDPTTAWRSGSLTGAVGQWLQVGLAAPVRTSTIRLAFAADPDGFPSRVRITTDAGSLDSGVLSDGSLQEVTMPPGPTRTIRVTVLAMADGTAGSTVGIATFEIPGVTPSRTVVVPANGGAAPDVVAFDAAAGTRGDCVGPAAALRCSLGSVQQGVDDVVLDRSFTLPAGSGYRVAGTVAWRPGAALDALLDDAVAARTGVRATASSTAFADPRTRAGAAVDGDVDTGWRADPGDADPSLTLTFATPRTVAGLRVTAAPQTELPDRLEVAVDGRTRSLPVVAGRVTLPAPVTATTVRLAGADGARLAGVAEVAPDDGTPAATASGARVVVGCADGPTLTLDGVSTRVTVSASVADVLAGRPALAGACSTAAVTLAAGEHRIALAHTDVLRPTGLTLTGDVRTGLAASGGSAGTATVTDWGSTRRSVRVDTTAPALFVVHENANAGWTARLGGTVLTPVTVDGWEQGYVVPAGSRGTVELTFGPQRVVTAGLVAGLVTAVGLLAAAVVGVVVRRRRGPVELAVRPDARWSPWPAAAGGGLAALAVAGWWGLGAVVVVVAAGTAVRGRGPVRPWWRPLAVVVAALAAGGLEALAPAGSADPLSGSVPVTVLLVVALTLTVGPAGVPRWRGRSRPPRSEPGTSDA